MKQRIRLTEGDLHRIIKETVDKFLFQNKIINESASKMLNEGKIETWGPDDFITWDDYQYYCNHSYDWLDKNRIKSDKLGVPEDQRCYCCQKPLNGPYKTLYVSDDYNDVGYYAKPNKSHNRPLKIGKVCAKAFEKAHKDKYGY